MTDKKKMSERMEKFDMCNAASFGDCTGLIQVPPEDDYEYKSYKAVYDFAPSDSEENEKDESEESDEIEEERYYVRKSN